MINVPIVQAYARQRGLSSHDALQTFMQVIVLRHLTLPGPRLIGGTALVLGHDNPRFSEDVDLTQVSDPHLLKPGLAKAAAELERWFGRKVLLTAPKPTGRTWRLSCPLSRSETIRLHVDCQEYAAVTTHPVVLKFPSIPTFVFEAEGLEEIMADKVIAVGTRRYLGGRDLFDLWFHWLRHDDWSSRRDTVLRLVDHKLKERLVPTSTLRQQLKSRLFPASHLERVREEWRRYLPKEFHRESVRQDILRSSRKLLELI